MSDGSTIVTGFQKFCCDLRQYSGKMQQAAAACVPEETKHQSTADHLLKGRKPPALTLDMLCTPGCLAVAVNKTTQSRTVHRQSPHAVRERSRASGDRANSVQRSSAGGSGATAGESAGSAHSTAVNGRSRTRDRRGAWPPSTCQRWIPRASTVSPLGPAGIWVVQNVSSTFRDTGPPRRRPGAYLPELRSWYVVCCKERPGSRRNSGSLTVQKR